MKKSIFAALFVSGTVWFATTQIGSATLLVAYSSYTSNNSNENPDYAADGFWGSLSKSSISSGNGGSNDNKFTDNGIGIGGPGGVPTFPEFAPGTNNGNVNLPNNQTATARFINWGGPEDYTLKALMFDAVASTAGTTVNVSYRTGVISGAVGSYVSLYTTPNLPATGATSNYGDYVVSLLGLGFDFLQNNYIEFKFTGLGSGTAFLDNVALTIVPEPASFAALACLLGSGVLLRYRRRGPALRMA